MGAPITAATRDFVSLLELKAQVNIAGTRDDAELALVKDAAQEQAEAIVGDVLHRTRTETHTPSASGAIVLLHRPVVAVASVVAGGTTLDAAGYRVNLSQGIIRGVFYRREVTVTYTSGRTEVAHSVRLATLILGQHLWATQRGRQGPAEYEGEVDTGMGFAIPSRAAELLQPYALGGAFA